MAQLQYQLFKKKRSWHDIHAKMYETHEYGMCSPVDLYLRGHISARVYVLNYQVK